MRSHGISCLIREKDVTIPPALDDEKWMREALRAAENAVPTGDVPVGAIVVCEEAEVARAWNRKEELKNPIAHAELLALAAASKTLGHWRLTGCTLYVTLEPCVMCSGAIVHSRVDRVVYATPDPKTGAVQSIYSILADQRLNHTPQVSSDVLQAEASQMLKDFFRQLRTGNV
jgi:tRNA(Arg) A34 adenosine deaminase TadA